MLINSDKIDKGFTLLELLVTITVFSVVMTSFLGLFVSVFREQRKSLASSELLNNASFVTEYMSRALRMAQKDMDGTCITAKENYQNPGGDISKIRFLNYQGQCQEFFNDDKILKVRKSADEFPTTTAEDVTAAGLLVENLRFELWGASQFETPNYQPKITVVLKLSTKGGDPQILNLQTTISQRELDILR